jgi:hypothetical protein
MRICRDCDRDFLFCFERPSALRLQYSELGMPVSVKIYPHKLNSAVHDNVKILSCVVTVKTVSIVSLYFGISLIAVPS